MPFTDSLPGPLAERLSAAELPRPIYAVLGVAVLARSEIQSQADVHRVPADLANGLRNGAAAAGAAASALAGRLSQTAADLRGDAKESYEDFVEQGHDAAVAYATERAVRSKVSKVEDKVAPRAGRAAAKYVDIKRRWQEAPSVQRTKSAAQRASASVRRGAARFSEMNAPVMAEDVESATDSGYAGS